MFVDNKKQSKKNEMDDNENQEKLKKVVQGCLAKARNPASRMEAKLKAAEEKIKQLEHEKKEESKIAEIIQEEHVAKIEQYEKIIMMMASEIQNLHAGKEPELEDEQDKSEDEKKELQATVDSVIGSSGTDTILT